MRPIRLKHFQAFDAHALRKAISVNQKLLSGQRAFHDVGDANDGESDDGLVGENREATDTTTDSRVHLENPLI